MLQIINTMIVPKPYAASDGEDKTEVVFISCHWHFAGVLSSDAMHEDGIHHYYINASFIYQNIPCVHAGGVSSKPISNYLLLGIPDLGILHDLGNHHVRRNHHVRHIHDHGILEKHTQEINVIKAFLGYYAGCFDISPPKK